MEGQGRGRGGVISGDVFFWVYLSVTSAGVVQVNSGLIV